MQWLSDLISVGADVNIVTKHEETALAIARSRNYEKCVNILVQEGADVNIPQTPLTVPIPQETDGNLDNRGDQAAKEIMGDAVLDKEGHSVSQGQSSEHLDATEPAAAHPRN